MNYIKVKNAAKNAYKLFFSMMTSVNQISWSNSLFIFPHCSSLSNFTGSFHVSTRSDSHHTGTMP